MPDTLHLADADDVGGFALARLISQLGVSPQSPATFAWNDRGNLAAAWTIWLEKWFAPHLSACFVEVYHRAAASLVEEIEAADRRLDAALTDSLRSRSLQVAGAFLEGKSERRAHRQWQRFVERIASGHTPGHTTTLFALQCALYHLPLGSALSAYAWFELESALPPSGSGGGERDYRDKAGSAEEVLAAYRLALPHVAVALRGDRDEHAGETSAEPPSRLRAI
ncbi:MAG: hypothetical protein GXX91_01855 [Verrucomicrobiaceae bacterium]|nr:hypothetical protein [Verrucomicrobiaceae bacterium]